MKFEGLQKEARVFRPAIVLDRIMAPRTRYFIKNICGALAILFAAYYVFVHEDQRIAGLFLIALVFWLKFLLLDFFYNSFYFGGEGKSARAISFEAATVLYDTKSDDVTLAFVGSSFGRVVLLRLAITEDFVDVFSGKRSKPLRGNELKLGGEMLTLTSYAKHIYENDEELRDAFATYGVTEELFLGAVSWIEDVHRVRVLALRWWSRERLLATSAIGKDWSYGGAYFLERFAKPMAQVASALGFFHVPQFEREESKELEGILAKRREANALLISEKGGGGLEVVYQLWERVKSGQVHPALSFKRILFLDSDRLIAATKDKANFESTMIKVMNDAIAAGNIILVIDDLPTFVLSAKALGSDVPDLLDAYLVSDALQVVALSDPNRFHEIVEPAKAFGERFETVKIKVDDDQALLRILEHQVLRVEYREKIFFTFQALFSIVRDAERYFTNGVTLDKVIDLLDELVPKAKQEGVLVITEDFVEKLVEAKTGIPIGRVDEKERGKLLSIGEDLRKRIVGQETALDAVAGALKRSRAGAANPKRPTGSFLFLGPTGVGKTETTKALADIYFGNEDALIRFDMTEFTGEDGLSKLIGSFESAKVGLLVEALKESPYGVLLLDEFEKASTAVRDLFLQVIDEGFFTDSHGGKVNALNLIIIATSNAGSPFIWELMKKGENLNESKDKIIEHIIKEGIFRPELLNRFDEVVLFHPLSSDDLAKIAKLMLEKLAKRLQTKGIRFKAGDDLVAYLVRIGTTEQFGARAMNRVIQDSVEQYIADRIIKESLKPGAIIEVGAEDLK